MAKVAQVMANMKGHINLYLMQGLLKLRTSQPILQRKRILKVKFTKTLATSVATRFAN